MLLNLNLHRGSQPAFVLAVDPIVKSGLAVAGFAVPSGPPELPAGGQVLYYIIAGSDLGRKQFPAVSGHR